MGYEIRFLYHKKKSEGIGYDTETTEEMKVSVGKQWDDIDIDEVAKAIFGQLAKRNILIVDAEVYEYTKKKVSFKMKDDGIVVKNRKFSYDITGAIKSSSEEEVVPHQVIPVAQVAPQTNISELPPEVQAEIAKMRGEKPVITGPKVAVKASQMPIRREIFDPHPDLLRAAKAKGLPFKVGKDYPIFEEKPDMRGVMFGMNYLTEDDNGNRRVLNDKHFVPIQKMDPIDDAPRPNHQARLAYDDTAVPVGNGQTMRLPDIHTFGGRRR